MIKDFIFMSGYGFYVWLSFGVVLFSCLIVYLKTRKTLRKYEKDFLIELETLSEEEKQNVLEKSKIANQILAANSKVN
jgi:heme exporter protein D